MNVDYYCISECGGREVNEDAIGIFNNGIGSNLFALSDGLGGHGYGEIASSEAVSIAGRIWENSTEHDFFRLYFSAVEKRLTELQSINNRNDDYKTTSVIAYLSDGIIRSAHIGDSRMYFFRNNRIRFRSLDHSVPQMLVLSGEIKDKDIRNHPDRCRLLKVLGNNPENIFYDMHDDIEVLRGDAMLLCSDGFWELIRDKEMCKCLKKSCSASEWGIKMKDIVFSNGAKATNRMDNFSAICVMFR